jgi:hypothetical protein
MAITVVGTSQRCARKRERFRRDESGEVVDQVFEGACGGDATSFDGERRDYRGRRWRGQRALSDRQDLHHGLAEKLDVPGPR